MKKIFPIILLMLMIVSVLSVLSSSKAYACSCGETTTGKKFENSSVVFAGTLVSKDIEGGNTFRVDKLWKGELSNGYVYSGFFGMCGTEFEEGSKYLVYTFNHKGNENTDICSGNKLISEASTDIEDLNRIIEPEWRTYFPWVMVFGLVLALLIRILRNKWKKL